MSSAAIYRHGYHTTRLFLSSQSIFTSLSPTLPRTCLGRFKRLRFRSHNFPVELLDFWQVRASHPYRQSSRSYIFIHHHIPFHSIPGEGHSGRQEVMINSKKTDICRKLKEMLVCIRYDALLFNTGFVEVGVTGYSNQLYHTHTKPNLVNLDHIVLYYPAYTQSGRHTCSRSCS